MAELHELQCSFCKKLRAEVAKLVAGPGVSICDECVGLCVNILLEAAPAEPLPAARLHDPAWRRWLRRVF